MLDRRSFLASCIAAVSVAAVDPASIDFGNAEIKTTFLRMDYDEILSTLIADWETTYTCKLAVGSEDYLFLTVLAKQALDLSAII